MEKLPEYLNPQTCRFQGQRIALYTPTFQSAQGKTYTREIITHPGAVVILPFVSDTEILLIRNYRVAIDQYLLELPAGTMERDEAPEFTAERELVEETGYQAQALEELTRFYTTPGFTNELMIGYLAHHLKYQGQKLEETEDISVQKIPFEQAFEFIKKGQIRDAKSILLLLYYSHYRLKVPSSSA
jgi:ADP-ribose pyrophosphatase